MFRSLTLALIFSAVPVLAQTATDFQNLEKQVQQLQERVNKLQREQADSTINVSGTAAAAAIQEEENRIKLSTGVTQLKLFGDLRFREQVDTYHPLVTSPSLVTSDRERFRFRLRMGADVQLGDQFFAGVTLATGQPSDSNNANLTEGYDNYSIYVDKAFAGWQPNDWFSAVIGKQANPFYTTDLVWDPDITPAGIVETLDLTKALIPDESRFSLKLISMQGIFEGNSNFTVGSDTAWQFVEQLQASYHFNRDTSITFAPGFMTYTSASLTGLQNSVPFTKPNDTFTAPNGVQTQTTTTDTQTETVKYDSTGKPSITLTPVNTTTTVTTTDPATGASRSVATETTNNQTQVTIPYGAKGNSLKENPTLANKTFVTTKTLGGGATTVTSPVGESPAAETADLAILTAPGDVSFKIGGLDTKVYWDFAYNTEGSSRATNEYFLSSHTTQDDIAWLAGFQLGNNERAGDLSFNASFRQVGMDSIDPNLNDSEFALSYLNVQGIKLGLAYNFTDSFVGAFSYYGAWTLRHGLTGGEATSGAQLANAKTVNVLQVELNVKF
ncbi:MAG TPA: putative porin [Chthoniobacteraceae bacterium]|jgi:hypothetical protein|nr:putative porin [Chthoniobacteraceae bacterium]